MEQLSVAIADDNQKILNVLGEIVSADRELDLVGKAKNGEEMCQIIKDRQPDVVLLDLIMPKMDGLTVMEQINQSQPFSKRPYFIVVTAVGQERITEDAFNKGANYYVMKPFNNDMLLDRIKSVRKMFRNYEKKNEDGRLEGTARGEDLENRVTNVSLSAFWFWASSTISMILDTVESTYNAVTFASIAALRLMHPL